jgi:hypothetical protein
LGILCLGLAGGCWRWGAGGNSWRHASVGILGFLPLIASFWFVYQAFWLASFGVAPCASISLPHVTVSPQQYAYPVQSSEPSTLSSCRV